MLAAVQLLANPEGFTKPFNITSLKVMTAWLLPCRLGMLERLCTTWHGWVSAAVYLPASPSGYTTHLHVAVAQLDQLHADFEQGSACCLSLMSLMGRPGLQHMPLTESLFVVPGNVCIHQATSCALWCRHIQPWHIVPVCNHKLMCTNSA